MIAGYARAAGAGDSRHVLALAQALGLTPVARREAWPTHTKETPVFDNPDARIADTNALVRAINRAHRRSILPEVQVEPHVSDDAVIERLSSAVADELEHRRASSDFGSAA